MDTREKNAYQKELFVNRVSKQYRQLRKWARKNRITSYRLYDRDIPEIPLALDVYTLLPSHIETKLEAVQYQNECNAAISENGPRAQAVQAEEKELTYAHLYLYERPYEKDAAEEDEWLSVMAEGCAEVLGIKADHVITKTRKKLSGTEEGRTEQYEKLADSVSKQITGIVAEQGQLFNVNLTDYLDTGLFLDHRPLRKIVRESCAGKSVLNLFCYTGSFSVYAAEGKASRVQSVDMSRTYLEWAERNLELNGFSDKEKYVFTRGDAVGFLNQMNAEVANKEGTNRFDIIVLDPPTFSNSKRTDTTLDINRDWPSLVEKCLNILTPGGVLYFSTNSRRLKFTESPLYNAEDITAKTIPEDYRNSKIHRAWKITRA